MKCFKIEGSNGCTVCVYTQVADFYAVKGWILLYLNYYFNKNVTITTTENVNKKL